MAVAGQSSTWLNGNDLWEYCGSDSASPSSLACMDYVMGVADAMTAHHEGVNGFHACFRATMTRGQIIDVVKRWLQNHPENRSYTAAGIVAAALQQSFPCSP